MHALMILALLTFAGHARGAETLISDKTHQGVRVPLTSELITCIPARPSPSFPVDGELTLKWNGIRDITQLVHAPYLTHRGSDENCHAQRALIARARGGMIEASVRVTLKKVTTAVSGGGCNLELIELVSADLSGVAKLTSERHLDLGQCER